MVLKRLSGGGEADFNIYSLDSEDADGKTYVWCIYGLTTRGREIKKTFTKPKQVISFLFRRIHRKSVLTGLNLQYDLNTLRYKGGYDWIELTPNGRFITASPQPKDFKTVNNPKGLFRNKQDYIRMIDLGNFIQNRSLKTMAEDFGLGSEHIDKHILNKDGNLEEMKEACMSHAKTGVLVFKALQDQLHKLGAHIKLTSSSTAMDLFRRKYLSKENEIYDFENSFPGRLTPWMKGSGDVEEAIKAKLEYMKQIGKAAYVGGRTENFILGVAEHQDYLDINSSYPAQMRYKDFPDMNTYEKRSCTDVESLKGYMQDFEGEALIKVKAPKGLLIPFLHHKGEDGKLIFPLGVFTGWYTFPEIRKALSIGYEILEIYEIAIFGKAKELFNSYIDKLMELKVKKDTKNAAKLLMNGLSGKFGERSHKADKWRLASEEDIKSMSMDKLKILETSAGEEGQVYYYDDNATEEGDGESDFTERSYPLIVAYVTAYGRIQLYECMESIGLKHVHYCDTDSIIADSEAVQAAIKAGKIIIDKDKLGAWDLVHSNITVEVRGLKYYRFKKADSEEWHYTIKGVPSKYHAEYWEKRGAYITFAMKQRQALRQNKRVNEFVTRWREDRVKRNNKRVFEPEDNKKTIYFSKPFIVSQ